MGLLRRHRPGRHRHLDRPRRCSGCSRSPRATSAAIEASLLALAAAHRDTRDARPHARPARAADHVRLQGGGVGGRDRAATSSASTRPSRGSRSASSPARSARCRPGATHGPRAAAPRAGAARPRRARHRAGSPRATGSPSSSALLALVTGTLAKIGNEVYNLQRPEIGELSRGADRGRRRQHHDAAEAQPRALRAPVDARARRARGRRRSRSRAWSASTSATAPRGRPSGRSCPQACGRRGGRAGARAPSSSPACASTRERMRANLDAQRGYVLAEPVMLALGAAGRQAPRARARPRGGRAARRGAGPLARGAARPTPRSRRCCSPERLDGAAAPGARARRVGAASSSTAGACGPMS